MQASALDRASHQDFQKILALLQPDGSFSDLEYEEPGSEAFVTHGRRQSALLYHHWKGKKNLTAEADLCFRYITYDAPPINELNWWNHIIGVPVQMWQGAALAQGVLDQKLLLDFLDRYWANTLYGPVWNPKERDGSNAGGNFGPRALLGEVEGLLRGTYQRVHSEVASQLHDELVERNPYEGNGVRPDGCIHQHNPAGSHSTVDHKYLNHTLGNPYSGEYGKEMMSKLSLMMAWYSGTDLDYEEAAIEGLYSTYFQCHQWVFRGGVIEPTLVGRKIPTGIVITYYSVRALIADTGYSLLEMGRHREQVEAVLHRYENVVPAPEYALVGHRHFFNSDLSVHQRREYYASVRILSNRTVRPESWLSGENIDGYFQADGFMTILVDGGEYGEFKNEVFQVYDWARVPSVTNQYTTEIPSYQLNTWFSRYFYNDAKFSGGVTDGLVGLASMVYNRPHVPLRALKSWFFFDDVIVVVGSGITLDPAYVTHKYVGTTLTQIVFEGQFVVCTGSGKEETGEMGIFDYYKPSWLFHRNVSYVFLNGDEHLHTTAETRYHDDKELDVFMAWITHKADPINAMLAYAVLPATNLEATRQFLSHPTVEVVTQNDNKHVVCHHPSVAIGASLVDAGKVTVESCGSVGPLEIEVDTPCLMLATVERSTAGEATIFLSVSDPQQVFDAVNVKINFEGSMVEKVVNLPLDSLRGSSATVIIRL
ncbi:LOW QUALITY PROTEIN: chondroitinase-AC-like [Macrobrachium rosenbergii]|uniref:LOW QUALITY PROTEIN: chondroitinase-AC-like n=1 Tax=Macrobrachium rosenbergii TaxID=79674 RepID=UPI0034D7AA19